MSNISHICDATEERQARAIDCQREVERHSQQRWNDDKSEPSPPLKMRLMRALSKTQSPLFIPCAAAEGPHFRKFSTVLSRAAGQTSCVARWIGKAPLSRSYQKEVGSWACRRSCADNVVVIVALRLLLPLACEMTPNGW